MSGYIGKFLKGMLKEGAQVSTKTMPDAVVGKKVFGDPNKPGKLKVEIISKDGKQKGLFKLDEIKKKPGRARSEQNIPEVQRFEDPIEYARRPITEEELSTLRPGEIKNRLLYDPDLSIAKQQETGRTGNELLLEKYGGELYKGVRGIGRQQLPGLRRKPEEIKAQSDFARRFKEKQIEAAKKAEQQKKKQVAEEVVASQQLAARRQRPNAEDPFFRLPGGAVDMKKLREATSRFENNKSKKEFMDNPTKPMWAKGGSVKVNKKKQNIKKTYRTVTNRFSDRMLPGKKRTTRIY
jgi:hypothetical protein